MRSAVLTAVGCLALAASPANAADWWLVDVGGHKPTRIVFLIDKASMTIKADGVVQAWLHDYYETANAGVQSDRSLFQFDCANRTSKSVSWISYSKSGDVVGSHINNVDTETADPLAPGTVGEEQLSFACGNSKGIAEVGDLTDPAKGSARLLVYLDNQKQQHQK